MSCLSPQGKTGITLHVISRDRPIPPYLQLAAIIRDKVTSGELPRGSRLPSILEMSGEYHVSVPTVRKALAVLKGEGLVTGVGGYGTFISEDADPKAPGGRT
jgi:GntR family transcriptional regulator